ncbi:MAG TPA: 3-isopropylmalate dehydrogenase [bacterium]|nr:3-isopropylmalate dehydrogenase [bacterium]
MHKTVAVMAGDGIGPEVTRQGVLVLQAAGAACGIQVATQDVPIGGAAYDLAGSPLPPESLAKARAADVVLLGAVGGPKWDRLDFALRPEKGLLKLRAELELFANLRPAQIYGDLVQASTLKPEVVQGVDLMVIRELTGDIYFGEPRGITTEKGVRVGRNTMVYSEPEIERIVRVGFDIARKRRKKLCSVDKANVLETSVLWREVATRVHREFADVALEHLYVDNAAMQLIRSPKQFDTIVTGNLFGDILSDAAAMLTGSIGMLPSASIGQRHALYEPVHGSAPDIAGKDAANPLATILSVGMLFRYTLNRPEVDDWIRAAVTDVLARYRTADIQAPGTTQVGCQRMGEQVLTALEQRIRATPPAAR